MKLGSNFAKVRRVLTRLGLADRALYVERASMHGERSVPLADIDPTTVPYFSMLLLPGAPWQGA
jgi:precorrin-2 methylase